MLDLYQRGGELSMKAPLPRVVTVILNTNRRDDTLACLASLKQSNYPDHHIVVLDNASYDGSVPAIATAYPEVDIIALEQNLGYAGNNNLGIQAALAKGAEWIFILNEDTVLAPDCIEHLVEMGAANPKIGMMGPLVYHFDEPSVIQSAGGCMDRHWQTWHLAHNEEDRGQVAHPHTVEWVSGCALMVRRAVIEQVGMLDERFYYYWEETEWCFRARWHGWLAYNVPQAKLWHKGVCRHYQPSPMVTYYNTRNRLLFMYKHRASLRAWLGVCSQIIHTLTSWTLRSKWRAMRPHRDALLQGATDFARQRWGMRSR
jgi:GT2 family glycosyltransferase